MTPIPALLAALLLVPPAPPVPPVSALGPSLAPSPVTVRPPARDGPAPMAAVRPVPGPVVNGFDPPAEVWDAGHRGVDLAAGPGDLVVSALPGTVTFAAGVAGRGVVTVDHGGRRTSYEPIVAWVGVGEEVGAGEVLGVLEATPGHCYPASCLHWGLREGDTYLDPLTLLGPRRVRLLPLFG